jgi:hypothetical protein
MNLLALLPKSRNVDDRAIGAIFIIARAVNRFQRPDTSGDNRISMRV